MSTISPQFPPSPTLRDRMLDALSAQNKTGGVTASDATSADLDVDGIDTDPTGYDDDEADAGSLDPSGIGDRIDNLLAQQVQNGSLTGVQADTLKEAFHGLSGGRETAGVGQRSPGSLPGSPLDAETAPDAVSASPPTSTSSTEELLASFVKQLQTSQTRSSPYGADGARSSGPTTSALLLNFKV